MRRLVSTNYTVGLVLARSTGLRLERDGTFGGLRAAWDRGAGGGNSVNCMGMDPSGTAVNFSSNGPTGSTAGTSQVFTNAQNVVYATCSFGGADDGKHVTQVTLQRHGNGPYWVGRLISSYNQ